MMRAGTMTKGREGTRVRTTLVVLIAVLLIAVGCSSSDESDPAPTIDAATGVDLQVRAFMRACQDVICSGAPIYAPDSTTAELRQAILETYTDEVEYLSESEMEKRTNSDGRFADGATLVAVESVRGTERDDVKAVNVGISRGFRDFNGRSYLFVWNGTEWADASADAVNVTVTSSVA